MISVPPSLVDLPERVQSPARSWVCTTEQCFPSPASLPWSLHHRTMISVSRLAPVSHRNNDFSLPPRSRGVYHRTMISVSRLAPVGLHQRTMISVSASLPWVYTQEQ
ncbi:hypothetical protein RRG08_065158 [Elysia crispata]|uniref:Uncharacterized protein n=1 Tax=Elysia crispata TaxID=231223 RepID=A0AAE1DGQ9_9GAST|nr:hypothetical protein RRG08_065158 [Elysia crispata]